MKSGIVGPQFGGRIIRTHIRLPHTTAAVSIKTMRTLDIKIAKAILSEELRLAFRRGPRQAFASIKEAMGWSATDRQINAMKARLAELDKEITKRNFSDLKSGKIEWTSPHSRHTHGTGLSVSLAEAASVR